MANPKMSLNRKPKSAEEFIAGAATTPVAGDFPWNDPKIREDIMKMVSLRLPESEAVKLQWISEQTGIPQQRFLREWLIPLIDEKIKSLTVKG